MNYWYEEEDEIPFAPEVEAPSVWLDQDCFGLVEDFQLIVEQPAVESALLYLTHDWQERLPLDCINHQTKVDSME